MRNCFQFQNLSVLGHGIAVMRKARLLYKEELSGFVLPEWFKENIGLIKNNLYDWKIIKRYTLWHDCGKPYCRTVDESGKQHFPDHAKKSGIIFLENVSRDIEIANLISNDMVFHTVKADELQSLLANTLGKREAFTLLLVAFAELHANAEMFGGTDNVSFKIKWKQLDKRGKQVLTYFKEGN